MSFLNQRVGQNPSLAKEYADKTGEALRQQYETANTPNISIGEIPSEVNGLTASINDLQDELGMLVDKLRPLIPPPPPAAQASGNCPPEPVRSILGSQIHDQVVRLHGITDAVRDLRSLIAL